MADPLELIAVEVSANVDKLEGQMQNASRVVDVNARDITRSVESTERAIVQSSERSGQALQKTGGSARLLGQQFSQMGQQVAAGTNPLQALAIQLPDLAVVMGQTEQRAGSLAAFFAGPWGLALSTAAAVAISLGVGIMDAEDKTKKAEASQRDLIDVLNDSTASYEEVTAAAQAYAKQNEIVRATTINLMGAEAAAISNRLKLALATRQLLGAELERRKGEVSGSSILAPQGYQQGLIAREQAIADRAAANEKQIAALQGAAQNVTTRIVDRLATLRSDPAARISEGFEILRQRARGSIKDVDQLANRLADLNRQEEKALARQRSSDRTPGGRSRSSTRSAGKTEAERAAEAAEKAKQRLDEQYEKSKAQLTLEGQLADLRAKGTEEASRTADIMEAQARLATQFPELDKERLKVLQDIAAININAAYDRKGEKEALERNLDDIKAAQDARKKAADDLQRRQEQQIYTLANLYEDAFRGGTDAIWRDFKSIGLRVVAQVLAQFTAAQLSGKGGGFSFGGAIASAIGAVLPGFASGGSMVIGGRGGTDNNVLSMNGNPIARVSAGEVLNIANPNLSSGRMGGGATQVTIKVQANDYFDARVAGISQQVAVPVAQQVSAQASAAMGQNILRAVPSRIASYQRDGT